MRKISEYQIEYKIRSILNSKCKNKKIVDFLENIIINILVFIYYVFCIFFKIFNFKNSNYNNIGEKEYDIVIPNNKPNKKDLSILIPVFNAEKTIRRCIESIIKQNTLYNYEIIIVNDGSIDNSLKIIEGYSMVKVISQENHGIAYTRNVLLDNAEGEYIMFVDSDDYLLNESINFLMDSAKNEDCDIVQGSFCKETEKRIKYYTNFKTEIVESEYEKLKLPGYPWGKVIKRTLFERCRFITNLYFEDTIFTYWIYSNSKKTKYISECVYCYEINNLGLTKNLVKDNKCIDTIQILKPILKMSDITYDLYKFSLNCQLSFVTYFRIKGLDSNMQRGCFEEMCNIINNLDIDLKKGECFITKNMDLSFKTRNFRLWKYTSILLNIIK